MPFSLYVAICYISQRLCDRFPKKLGNILLLLGLGINKID
ncbi:hypothetical protein FDUTEX481_08685 [Tolypothrix sp. PCC 7601]|nr:hypothetical protein FDUTEX481_08685 [Tolypothrix sp. PCC 7601]